MTRSIPDTLQEVFFQLESHHGPMQWKSEQDPVDVLVETILSQSTTDHNRDMAFRKLKATHTNWDEVISISQQELAETIRSAGLHHQKAERIQVALKTLLEEQGEFSLDYLRSMTPEEAVKDLTRLPGVGKKTAGIILTFSLNIPYFAVDTHVTRITRRLGWVPPKKDPHDVMNELVPDDLKGPLHIHLVHHGRQTCKARKPLCDECAIKKFCPVFKKGAPL